MAFFQQLDVSQICYDTQREFRKLSPIHYQNEYSPSDLNTTTLDEENVSDTEPGINRFSEEPETSGSEFVLFAKSQDKQQKLHSLSKRLNENDYDATLLKKQKQNSYDSQAFEFEKKGKLA